MTSSKRVMASSFCVQPPPTNSSWPDATSARAAARSVAFAAAHHADQKTVSSAEKVRAGSAESARTTAE